MKRREPTADELGLFEAALRDVARLTPNPVGSRDCASTKSKKTATPAPAAPSALAASSAPRGTKGRSKRRHDSLEPEVPPQPQDAVDVAAHPGCTAADERALFEAAFKDVLPLGAKPVITRRHPPARSKATTGITPAGSGGPAPSPGGLNGRMRTKLRRGSLEPEARLDLHGLNETAAHHALCAFVHQAMARGLRLVLIVTGKGESAQRDGAGGDDPFARRRGVLRQLTPRWLKEPGLARFVAEMTPAHRRHGGQGALYVYLRKPG